MSQERYTRVKDLFLAACDVPTSERSAFLAEQCEDDSLRLEVESLLNFEVEGTQTTRASPSFRATPRAFNAGDIFADRYRIVARIGVGGMGEVYRADDLTLGVPIAIKFLRRAGDTDLELLINEVRLAREVTHPNVCRVFDVGQHVDEIYLTMEYVAGENLASLLRRVGRLPAERVREVGADICAGLEAAHLRGVLHRDLKPANVLIDERGRVQLTDFGIAIRGEDAAAALGVPKGTPAYMAPEQFDTAPGHSAVSEHTDLYALGAMLYELATGRVVFSARDTAELIELHRHAQPESPTTWVPELDTDLSELILQCLSKAASDRPQSAGAVGDSLRGGRASVDAPSRPRPTPTRPERRQITVVSVVWHGATGHDPEDLIEGLHEQQERARRLITDAGGSVAHREAYGLVAHFGYPTALEHAVERAVRAALEIDRASKDGGEDGMLRTRIGIDTGDVIVQGSEATPVIGDAPRIALHLRELATEADSILLSVNSEKLTRGRFSMRRVTGRTADDLEPFSVLGAVERDTPRMSSEHLTPLVGRDQEIGLLVERFQLASEERGQTVLITGEPGIGKSRLLHELRGRLAGIPHRWVEGAATPETQGSAFYPAIELIERLFGDRSPEEKIELVADTLAPLQVDLEDAVPLIADLLSLPDHERFPSRNLAPQQKRQRTIEFLVTWVLATCEEECVVFVLEDLHWADPSTLQVLDLLISQGAMSRLLVVLTARPEFRAPWTAHTHQTSLGLRALNADQTEQIVLGAGTVLPPENIRAVAARADGNPLFAEALAWSLGEQEGEAIPVTLRDLFAARLDRLGTHRETAQVAAVIGRDFEYPLIAALHDGEEATLREGLANLVQAGILYQRGIAPRARYRFQHTLLREAAAQSLVRGERRKIHSAVFQTLTERFPEVAERRPELLGIHLEGAARKKEAAAAFLQAGTLASESWAFAEAEAHMRRIHDILESDRETEQTQLEIELLSRLASALLATQGFSSQEAQKCLARARCLAEQVGPSRDLFQVLFGIWVLTYETADREATESLSDQLLELAQRLGEETQLVAHTAAATTAWFRGEYDRSEKHLQARDELNASVSAQRGELLSHDDGLNNGVSMRVAIPLFRGDFDRAEAELRTALKRAEESGSPFAKASVEVLAAVIAQETGDLRSSSQYWSSAMKRSEEYGLPTQIAIHEVGSAAVSAELGGGPEAVRRVKVGLAKWDEVGGQILRPQLLAYVARGMAAAGELDAAVDAALHGLELASTNLDSYYEPELRRIHGELNLRRGGDRAAAEADFRAALGSARVQGASLFELRAACNLARLWVDEEKSTAARELLEPIVAVYPSARGVDWETAQALLREAR